MTFDLKQLIHEDLVSTTLTWFVPFDLHTLHTLPDPQLDHTCRLQVTFKVRGHMSEVIQGHERDNLFLGILRRPLHFYEVELLQEKRNKYTTFKKLNEQNRKHFHLVKLTD